MQQSAFYTSDKQNIGLKCAICRPKLLTLSQCNWVASISELQKVENEVRKKNENKRNINLLDWRKLWQTIIIHSHIKFTYNQGMNVLKAIELNIPSFHFTEYLLITGECTVPPLSVCVWIHFSFYTFSFIPCTTQGSQDVSQLLFWKRDVLCWLYCLSQLLL
jgi:hypothetical protein